ncbi:30S ribosomal protein S3 [Clostridium aminobutyricum]|uniref:Small ribosomal subunit protein uS3 n=1 Tax=Clostridium aminobutyricum TaxID=33953 RepID=A0A939D921_CLOAM|nr:30S ribosomal protein S3 [Clostridium aminobutyricum]MBN7773694.1 30S ribosomal protein S3 [Clostridium aminobutyricum]
MGQKVSPHGLRVGIIKDWDSKWYAGKNNFSNYLIEDQKVREYTKKKLYVAGVSKVLIERAANNKIKVIVLTGKPGMVIGRAGDGIDVLKKDIAKITGKEVEISIIEIKKVEMDAQLSAESIAQALEKRISFRRAMKQAIGRTMKSGAKGIKVLVSGRLGGAEIARNEKYSEGNVPLHTLRADIDYGFAEADTTYGKIGVKVWINHGEILDKGLKSAIPEDKNEGRGRRDNRDNRDRPRRDNRDNRDGDRRPRRDSRDAKPELPKAINPRARKTPKVEAAPAVEPQAEVVVGEKVEATE